MEITISCDDIHEANMIVTEDGKPYIIDFDQFGYHHPYTVFNYYKVLIIDYVIQLGLHYY